MCQPSSYPGKLSPLQAAEAGRDGGGRTAPVEKPFPVDGLENQEEVFGGVGNEAQEKWVPYHFLTLGHKGCSGKMEENVQG